MKEQTKGIYHKFSVSRVDGRDKPGGDKQGAEYFVLDMAHDPHARAALLAYAVSCRRDYPALSRDLLAKGEGMPEAGRVRAEYTDDPEREWQEFWRDIVAPGGVVDIEQVKKELCDFSMLISFVPKVYDHVTGGQASKPLTLPSVICALHDDHVTELCDEAAKEVTEEDAKDAARYRGIRAAAAADDQEFIKRMIECAEANSTVVRSPTEEEFDAMTDYAMQQGNGDGN